MKGTVALSIFAFLISILGVSALAQSTPAPAPPATTDLPPTNEGNFSLTAKAVALPGGGQTVAGTVLGQTMAVTSSVSLRADELLAPASNLQVYAGGLQWFPGRLQKVLQKTNLNGLVPYVTASAGSATVSPPSGPSQKHIAILAGGGANYCANRTMCVNVAEVRWADLPGVSNSTILLSSGLTLTFGK